MTERELEAVADRAADKAIRNLFLQIGVDITEPIEVQKDFHHQGGRAQGGVSAHPQTHASHLVDAKRDCDALGGRRKPRNVPKGAGGHLRPSPPRLAGGCGVGR